MKPFDEIKKDAADAATRFLREKRKRSILNRHAPGLLAAARVVISSWDSGDLAGAVRELAAVVSEIDTETNPARKPK